jgi:hypothetical protein
MSAEESRLGRTRARRAGVNERLTRMIAHTGIETISNMAEDTRDEREKPFLGLSSPW